MRTAINDNLIEEKSAKCKNAASLEIVCLTSFYASQHLDELLEIHNLIPHQKWARRDMLASCDSRRKYVGKWHFSRVCVVNNTPVGLCIAFRLKGSLYIHRLAVAEKWRLHNVATILVYSSANAFIKQNKTHGEILVQTPKETPPTKSLVSFYKKLGFMVCDTKQYPNREDYVLCANSMSVMQTISNRINKPCL